MVTPRKRRYNGWVADLLFILILIAFFGVCVLLVHACERIVGAETTTIVDADVDDDEPTTRIAA